MKKIIVIITLCLAYSVNAQVAMSRYIQVKDGQREQFIKNAAMKTKIFNSIAGQTKFYTFNITTGPRTGEILRVRVEDSVQLMDNNNQKEVDYWVKNVQKHHTSSNSILWGLNKEATYLPNNDSKKMSRVIEYNIKSNSLEDFWRFRTRVAKAAKESGANVHMWVWDCVSGCDGNTVWVSFGHDNYKEFWEDNTKEWAKVSSKYAELYGEGSYEKDILDLDNSLEMYGKRTFNSELIPELSSSF